MLRSVIVAFGMVLFAAQLAASEARLKDLVEIEGMRGNDLVGYGLVVGLSGTGDGLRNSPFTEDAIANLLERLGVNVTGEQFGAKNVAAVLVTATLPAFARTGSRIDVTVSAIGDAKSLRGGTLIMTPLNAADGQIYAVGQGTVIAGGAIAEGDAASETKGVPTSGIIPSGARVEREVPFDFSMMSDIVLALRNPDFTTASRIENSINQYFKRPVAVMRDAGTVVVALERAPTQSPAHLLSLMENLEIQPAQRARVVIDERSGTIVLGSDVRISRVAISQGGLTLKVREAPLASQPNPFSNGETVTVPRTQAEIEEEAGTQLALIDDSVSLPSVIEGLNALGVSPRDMIEILKTIKAAGALHADLVVQ